MESNIKLIGIFLAFLVTASIYILQLIQNAKKIKKELSGTKEELKALKKKYSSSSFEIDLFQLNSIQNIVQGIFSNTHMDRFLILSAMNGKEELQFVSALYEQHEQNPKGKLSMGATSKYIDVKTDDHYREMMKKIEHFNPMVAATQDLKPGILKDIYVSEEIEHMMIVFLHRQRLDEDNDRVFFVSWATHTNKPIALATQHKLKGVTKRIAEHLIQDENN